jgi:hypothetical protein
MNGMDRPNFVQLEAIDKLHGLEWFWVRTLWDWEVKNQPIVWSCFMLIVLSLFLSAAVLIVYLTRPRKTAEANGHSP